MDNLNELGIKFGEGTTWIQKTRCGWCKRTPLHHTEQSYKLRGNICNKCSSMINDKHIQHINEERKKRLDEKKEEMERLGGRLEQEMTEKERQTIVERMMKLHTEIRHIKIDIEHGQ